MRSSGADDDPIVGRPALNPGKGHKYLIDAEREWCATSRRTVLILGEGASAALERQIKELNSRRLSSGIPPTFSRHPELRVFVDSSLFEGLAHRSSTRWLLQATLRANRRHPSVSHERQDFWSAARCAELASAIGTL